MTFPAPDVDGRPIVPVLVLDSSGTIFGLTSHGASFTAHLDAPSQVTLNIISGGSAVVLQGARDVTAQPWFMSPQTSAGVWAQQAGTWNITTTAGSTGTITVQQGLRSPEASAAQPWFTSPQTSAGVWASQAGSWTTGRTWSLASSGDSVLIHYDALGQKTSPNSVPVTVASDQVIAMGQAIMASSLPVAIASDQSSFPVDIRGSAGGSQAISATLVGAFYSLNVSPTISTGVNATLVGQPVIYGPRSDTAVTNIVAGVWSTGLAVNLQSVGAQLVAPVVSAGVFAQQAGTWNVNNVTAITSSVGTFAQQAGTWDIGTLTSITQSVGVAASVVSDPAEGSLNTTIPSKAVMMAGSTGATFSTSVLMVPNVTGVPLQGQTSSTGGELGLVTRSRQYFGGKPTYSAAGATSVAQNPGRITSIAYLFHPQSDNKRYQVNRIRVSMASSAGSGTFAPGVFAVNLNRITAEAANPGGVTFTPQPHDPADSASNSTFRQGAGGTPVRGATAIRIGMLTLGSNMEFDYPFADSYEGKPPTCRSGTAEGWEVNITTQTGSSGGAGATVPSGTSASASFVWTEETPTAQ